MLSPSEANRLASNLVARTPCEFDCEQTRRGMAGGFEFPNASGRRIGEILIHSKPSFSSSGIRHTAQSYTVPPNATFVPNCIGLRTVLSISVVAPVRGLVATGSPSGLGLTVTQLWSQPRSQTFGRGASVVHVSVTWLRHVLFSSFCSRSLV